MKCVKFIYVKQAPINVGSQQLQIINNLLLFHVEQLCLQRNVKTCCLNTVPPDAMSIKLVFIELQLIGYLSDLN